MTRGMKFFAVLVVLLLGANLLVTAYIGYQLFAMDARQKAAAEQLQNLSQLALKDLEDYNQNAYHSTQIDRITEQQLLAAETEIALLMKVITGLGLVVWK